MASYGGRNGLSALPPIGSDRPSDSKPREREPTPDYNDDKKSEQKSRQEDKGSLLSAGGDKSKERKASVAVGSGSGSGDGK